MSDSGLASSFNANRAALERFLRARCGDPADAEDLAQELWLKLQQVRGPVSEPLAYLFRMADNLAHDRRRSAQRRQRRDDSWQDLANGGAAGVSDAPSAERQLLARERLQLVQRALDDAGERTARIFRRFRIDEVGQRLIAEEEGISLSAVEKHLQKAYRTILHVRKALDADLPVGERHIGAGEQDGTDG